MEEYIDVRRDTSGKRLPELLNVLGSICILGCKPCWALIEYALDIDLPEHVAESPSIQALNQYANDLVTWSNVIHILVFRLVS